jgi:hypothetical protein
MSELSEDTERGIMNGRDRNTKVDDANENQDARKARLREIDERLRSTERLNEGKESFGVAARKGRQANPDSLRPLKLETTVGVWSSKLRFCGYQCQPS